MPLDFVELNAIKLPHSRRSVLIDLWGCIWERCGPLPSSDKERAEICRVHVRSWKEMQAALEPFFDIDSQGRWRHYGLEAARAATASLAPDPAEEPRPNPSLSAIRRSTGSLGGRASAAKRQERRLQAAAGDHASSPAQASDGQPNLLQDEAKVPTKTGDFACDPQANASRTPSWLVGLGHENSSKIDQPTNRAPEAKSEANGEANSSDTADGERATRALVKAVLEACPGKVERATALWGIETVKGWIAKGCSFEADFLPVLNVWAKTNKEVTNIANGRIESATFQARDARLAGDPPRATPARPDLASMSPFARGLHAEMERRFGTDVYLSWCARIEVVRVADGTVTLSVPSRFVKTWLSGQLAGELAAAARTVQADVHTVAIEVRVPAQPPGETIQGRGGAPP